MKKVVSTLVVVLVAQTTAFAADSASPENATIKPDILIIMPDQMRGDCFSSLGHPVVATPNLDKLAKDGVLFRRGYTTCPSCIPARYALLTGMSPQASGVVGYAQKKFDAPLLPAVLGEAGYTTVLVGRTMHQKPTNASHGYQREIEGSTYVDDDEYDTFLKKAAPESGGIHKVIETTKVSLNQLPAHPWPLDPALHPTTWTIRESQKIIAGTPADKPLFLTTSFYSPHPPLFALPKYHNAILKMNLPQPAHGSWLEQKKPGGGSGRTGIKGEALRQAQAGYYGLIGQIDAEIAPLIADFKARSEKAGRPWVIVFTSDHGEQLADHGYFRKCEPYEGSANIPFIITGSPELKFKTGVRKTQPVALEDLMPTLLALAGAPKPAKVDGVNLLPVLRDDTGKTRDILHIEHSPCYSKHQAFHCLTDGRFKYIWRPFNGEEQLFDLNADPHEEHDLAGNQSQVLQWREKLIQRLEGRPEGFTDGKKLIVVPSYPAIMKKSAEANPRQWTTEQAWEWYKKQPWLVGFNYVPSTACNTTEWWQKETFDPVMIDRELGWAHDLGFNTTRVFIQYIVWKQDPDGFKKRLDEFLELADKHGLTVMPVLFDDCSFGEPLQFDPFLGKQREPIPGMILPSWTPCPGRKLANDPSERPMLKRYVQDMLTTYGKDKRVVVWDLFNEPMNVTRVGQPAFLEEIFGWARAINPNQPLTIYTLSTNAGVDKVASLHADVISFHYYDNLSNTQSRIADLKKLGRPILCTEWMARPAGSKWATDLPMFKQQGVGCYSWGLVNGRTQCQFPWNTKPGTPEPKVWFHDLFHKDGKPYDPAEHAVIRKTTADKTLDWTKHDYAKFIIPAFTEGPYRFSDGWTRWTGKGPQDDRLFYANETGYTVTTTVAGTSLVLVHKVGPDCGIASVTVDGKPASGGDLDTYSPAVEWNRRTVVAQGLTVGPHEVVVTVTGKKSAKSSDAYVQIVAIEDDANAAAQADRWSTEKAWAWYKSQPWLVGFNFVPSTACNTTEMWQAETFDPVTIDRELGLAKGLGFNTTRAFIQYIVWKHDPEGFKKRFEKFLELADKHGITVMPVLFDDCTFGEPQQFDPFLGKQREPIPGMCLSSWTPSPGLKLGRSAEEQPMLKKYVCDMVGSFGTDKRILLWDLHNEPVADRLGTPEHVREVFQWAREAKPVQPLTIGVWSFNQAHAALNVAQLSSSDVISFHCYQNNDGLRNKIAEIKTHNRPVICTEWMARPMGGNWKTDLPLFKQQGVGCYNWGLVNGRTQCQFKLFAPRGSPEPKVWFHDLFHKDGQPYDPAEIEVIRKTTADKTLDWTGLDAKPSDSSSKMNSYKPASYQGWDAVCLSNKFVSLHLVPEIGGRIMQYALGDDPFLWVNQELAGKTPPPSGVGPENAWLNYGGDKLWPAPQGWDTPEQWPGPPDAVLDGGPYKLELLQNDNVSTSLRLTSGDDKRSGIRFSRVIKLHGESTRVSFEATMKNIGSKPCRWGIWAHTQLDGGKTGGGYNAEMRAYCPINPKSHFANGYSVIFGDEKNPSFQADRKRNLMTVNYLYKVGKIGLDSPGGWVATVNGLTGKVFVQQFAFEEGKPYPDGSSVEFWHNGLGSFKAWGKDNVMPDDPEKNPYVFESEILSPFANLKPGESYTWKYDWYSANIGVGKHEVVDCSAASVVSEPLQITATGDFVRVTGRFGVFAPGTMALEFYDAQGKVLKREGLGNVSPTTAIVLDKTLELSARAVSAGLVLIDMAGMSQTLQKQNLR